MPIQYQLLVCLVLALSTSSVFAQQEINITSISSSVINGEDFEFSCASSNLNLTDVQVVINGASDDDQLMRNVVNTTYVEFRLNATNPKDDGVEFRCLVDNGTLYESENLTLTVFYITFDQNTSNNSLWQEFLTGSSFALNCTAKGNPDNITITPLNTTANFSNVEFSQYNGTLEGGFTFTDALVNNAGMYTCTASNGLVNESITYRVFVGGPPVNATISQTMALPNSNSDMVIISFTIDDSSDAPARGVLIDVPGVESTFITFSDPIRSRSKLSYTLSTLLNGIAPSFYNLTFTPMNRLGNGTTVYNSVFLPGKDFTVNIATSNSTLPEQSNFTITCSTDTVYLGFIQLYINGRISSNFSNVVQVDSTNASVSFVFMSVQPSDLGSTFTCVGSVTETTPNRTSTTVTLNVLYAPRFQELNNVTRLLDYAVNSSFSLYCTLNSTGNPPSAGFRYINATKEFSNVNATVVGNTSLSYEVTQATVRNRVNLTCIANSSYATTTLTYLAFVGGPPNKITVVPVVSVQNGSVYLSLRIMDESDVPARNYTLVISDIYNHTISDVQPIVNQTFSDLLGKPVELFGSDAQYLNITASNTLGSTVVYRQILDIPVFSMSSSLPIPTSTAQLSSLLPTPSSTQAPTSEPVDNSAGIIALGVTIPLVLLLIGIFGVAIFFYLYRNRKTKGLTNFIALKDSASESVSYSSRRTSSKNRRTQYSALA